MPRAWASRTTSLTGTTVPVTFDMCVMATIRVRSLRSFSNSSRRNVPSLAIGAQRITAPFRSRWKFHGTMLEWCSMIESTISSSSPNSIPSEAATRLIASVELRVKMISSRCAALRKRRTVSRASSYFSVARLER